MLDDSQPTMHGAAGTTLSEKSGAAKNVPLNVTIELPTKPGDDYWLSLTPTPGSVAIFPGAEIFCVLESVAGKRTIHHQADVYTDLPYVASPFDNSGKLLTMLARLKQFIPGVAFDRSDQEITGLMERGK